MKYSFSLFCLFFIFVEAFSQSNFVADEKYILSMRSDTNKVLALNRLAKSLFQENPQKCIELAYESIRLSHQLNYTSQLTSSYDALAAAYWATSDYELSLNYLFKKASILEQQSNEKELAKTFLNMNSVYFEIKDYINSFKYIKKAEIIVLRTNSKLGLANVYNHWGVYYFSLDSLSKAESYWLDSKRLFEEIGDEINTAYLINNLAKIEVKNKNYSEAFKAYQKSLSIVTKHNEKLNIAKILINLGDISLIEGNFEQSRKFLNHALDTCQRYNFTTTKLLNYLSLSKLDSTIGDYKSALLNYQKYSMLSDSIFTKEKNNKILKQRAKFESLQSEKENHSLKENAYFNKLIILPLVIFLFLSIIGSSFIYKYYKQYKHANLELYEKSVEVFVQNEYIANQNNELNNYKENLEKIIEKRTKELILAKEKAEESDRLKSAFLSNISHEIRTPLNAINGFSQIIALPNLSQEKRTKFSQVISEGSAKLINIITDVIELSELHSNQAVLIKEVFDFVYFFKEIINEYQPTAKGKNIELITNLQYLPELRLIKTDKKKLNKIISHLIDNAIKFTAKGKVSISVELFDDQINFVICDTGIGISKEMKGIIFEPFRQIDIGLKRNYGGNGAGLALVKGFVDLLGGSIDVETLIDKGTSITVNLPIEFTYKPESNTKNSFEDTYFENVLIVEDEYSNYEYLAEILYGFCRNIYYAENGEQAIRFFNNNQNLDLILMDIEMPIINGVEATKIIKKMRPNLPIIALTAYLQKIEITDTENLFDELVLKPIEIKSIYEIVDKYGRKMAIDPTKI